MILHQWLLLLIGIVPAWVLCFRALNAARWPMHEAVRVAVGALAIYATALGLLWLDGGPWGLLIVAIVVALGSLAVPGEGLSRLTDAMGRLRLPLYLLCVAGVAMLLLVVIPITTFLTSPEELEIDVRYLVVTNARTVGLIMYVAAMLYMFAFTSRMRTLLTLIALTALALAIVYAFVLPLGYPPMAGLRFEQIPLPGASMVVRALLDAALVPVAALAVCAGLLRFGSRPLLVAIVLANISFGISAAIQASKQPTPGEAAQVAATRHEEPALRFSQTQPNVLIIFLDRFMGSYVESILQSDPELAERLRGFTWFPRTVSAGHNSIAGVHAMLGGYDYTPVEMNARGEPLRRMSDEAFSLLPHNFASQGYRVNLLNPRGLGFTNQGRCSALLVEGVNCGHFPTMPIRRRAEQMGISLYALPKSGYADLLTLLATMRSAPYLVKHLLHENGGWQRFIVESSNTTFREWAQLQALRELSFTQAGEPNYNFVTSLLAHEPHFVGEDCLPKQSQFVASEEEIERRGHISLFSLQHSIAARCTLLAVANYLDYLRSAGVYDNTKIVIVSDHGIEGPVEDRSTRAVAGGTTANEFVASRSVLLVKERHASGALSVSEQFTPNAEVPRIVCEEIGGCVNPFLNNKPIAADGRDDPFHVSVVPWLFSQQKPTSFVIEEQRVLKGKDPYDAKGWATLE